MRAAIHPKERLKLGRRGAILPQQVSNLPLVAQAKQKHQHPCDGQCSERIGDVLPLTRVSHGRKELSKAAEEMPHRGQKSFEQGCLLFSLCI